MDWTKYERLQALAAAASDVSRSLDCEGAANRELEAMAKGRPRAGTVVTALANEHLKLARQKRLVDGGAALLRPRPMPSSTWALVERLLAPLTGAERTVLLANACGETFEEMAERLGEPVGTLKSRAARARRKLQ